MGKNVFLIMVLFASSIGFADYTYTVESGFLETMSLNGNESLIMTGGSIDGLNLSFWSSARIEGTDPLIAEGNGGIWFIDMMSYATLELLGGEVHHLELGSDSRAVLSGGRIDELWSYQDVELVQKVDGGPWVPDPHIEIICRDWAHDSLTNILTGTWFDDTVFDIQLIDVGGYDPAIENIFFTPEPTTILLLGIGAIAIRRLNFR